MKRIALLVTALVLSLSIVCSAFAGASYNNGKVYVSTSDDGLYTIVIDGQSTGFWVDNESGSVAINVNWPEDGSAHTVKFNPVGGGNAQTYTVYAGTKPTDPPVDPTDPPVDPTDPPVDPTDPPVDPTDPPVDPTDPPVDPTDPPVDPTDVPTGPLAFAATPTYANQHVTVSATGVKGVTEVYINGKGVGYIEANGTYTYAMILPARAEPYRATLYSPSTGERVVTTFTVTAIPPKFVSATYTSVGNLSVTLSDINNVTEIYINGDAVKYVENSGTTSLNVTLTNHTFRYTLYDEVNHLRTQGTYTVDHLFDEWQDVKEPTCTEDGVQERTCVICGEKETNPIEKTGHTPVAVPAVEPTCVEDGLTEGSICSVCEEVLEEQEVIPALGHKPETVPGKKPTCVEDGLTDGSVCSVCGEVIAEQEKVPALGHTPKSVPGFDATCINEGLTEGSVCAVCGAILKAQTSIPALGHNFGEYVVTKPATCTEEGIETSSCSRCDATQTRTIDKIDHVPGEWVVVKPATDEEDGLEAQYCTACNVELATRVISAKGHTPGEWEVIEEPTCTKEGKEAIKCIDDGVVLETRTIPALGHDWDDGNTAIEPTCTEEGKKVYTCNRCGETKEESIPVIAHDYEWVETRKPTTTETGLRELKCTLCGDVVSSYELEKLPAEMPAINAEGLSISGVPVITLDDDTLLTGYVAVINMKESGTNDYDLVYNGVIVGTATVTVDADAKTLIVTLNLFDGVQADGLKINMFDSLDQFKDNDAEGTVIVDSEATAVTTDVVLLTVEGTVDADTSAFEPYTVDEEMVQKMLELVGM